MIEKYAAGLLMLLVACQANAAKEDIVVNVHPSGVTTIASKLGSSDIRVTMRTHEVEINEASREKPRSDQANCTFSRQPCIIVDTLNISAGGRDLFIPRSLFADLSDPTRAVLAQDGKGMNLTIYGGDASESFVLRVSFDASRIKQRILSSAFSPDKPLQETTYYERVMGD
jgi:hypothetical protein